MSRTVINLVVKKFSRSCRKTFVVFYFKFEALVTEMAAGEDVDTFLENIYVTCMFTMFLNNEQKNSFGSRNLMPL